MMPSPRQPRATGGEPAPGVALLPKARVLPDGFCARIETESSAERYPSDLPENHGFAARRWAQPDGGFGGVGLRHRPLGYAHWQGIATARECSGGA